MSERFPDEVAAVLTAAGWQPGRADRQRAGALALALAAQAAPDGRQHSVVNPAIAAFSEFAGIAVTGPEVTDAAGEQVARSSFVLDPLRAAHSVPVLAELGELLGVRLTPLGVEGETGLLAIDENGRVFLVDHTADWYLGHSLDEALCTLILGRLPARLRDDGEWR